MFSARSKNIVAYNINFTYMCCSPIHSTQQIRYIIAVPAITASSMIFFVEMKLQTKHQIKVCGPACHTILLKQE